MPSLFIQSLLLGLLCLLSSANASKIGAFRFRNFANGEFQPYDPLATRHDNSYIGKLAYSGGIRQSVQSPRSSKLTAILDRLPYSDKTIPDGDYVVHMVAKQEAAATEVREVSDLYGADHTTGAVNLKTHVKSSDCTDDAQHEVLEFEISQYTNEHLSMDNMLDSECVSLSYKDRQSWTQSTYSLVEKTTAENCAKGGIQETQLRRQVQGTFVAEVGTTTVRVPANECRDSGDESVVSSVAETSSEAFAEQYVLEEECNDRADAVESAYAFNAGDRWVKSNRDDARAFTIEVYESDVGYGNLLMTKEECQSYAESLGRSLLDMDVVQDRSNCGFSCSNGVPWMFDNCKKKCMTAYGCNVVAGASMYTTYVYYNTASNSSCDWQGVNKCVKQSGVVVPTTAALPFFENLTSTGVTKRHSKEPAYTVTAWVKGFGTIMAMHSATMPSACGRKSHFTIDSTGKPKNDWGCSDAHSSSLLASTTEWTHVAFLYDGYGTRSIVVGNQRQDDVQHDTSKDFFEEHGSLLSPTTHNTASARYNELGDVIGYYEYGLSRCLEATLAADHFYFQVTDGLCRSSTEKGSGNSLLYRRSIKYMISEEDFAGVVQHGAFSGQLDEVLVFTRCLLQATIQEIAAHMTVGGRFDGNSRVDHPLTGMGTATKLSWTRYEDFTEEQIERAHCFDSADARYETPLANHPIYKQSGQGRGYGIVLDYTAYSRALENVSSFTLSATDSLSVCSGARFNTKLVQHSYQETTHDECMAQQVDEGVCGMPPFLTIIAYQYGCPEQTFHFRSPDHWEGSSRILTMDGNSLVCATDYRKISWRGWYSHFSKDSPILCYHLEENIHDAGGNLNSSKCWPNVEIPTMVPSSRASCPTTFYPTRSYTWKPDAQEIVYDVAEEECTVGGDLPAWGQTQSLLFGEQGRNLQVFSPHEFSFHWKNKVGGDREVVDPSDLESMKQWCRGTISCAGLQLDGANFYPVEAVVFPESDASYGFRACDERLRKPIETAMQCFLHAAETSGPEALVYVSGDEFRSFAWGYEGFPYYHPTSWQEGQQGWMDYQECQDYALAVQKTFRSVNFNNVAYGCVDRGGFIDWNRYTAIKTCDDSWTKTCVRKLLGTACYEDAGVFKWTLPTLAAGTRLCSDEPSDCEFVPFQMSRWQRDNDTITSTKEDDCTLHKLDWKPHSRVYVTSGTGSRPHFLLQGQKSWQREPVDCLYATGATFAIDKTTARECRDEAIFWGATGFSFQGEGAEYVYHTPRHFTRVEEARAECQRLHAHREGPENSWDLCSNAEYDCAADNSCITSDTTDGAIFAVAACCFNTGTSCSITTNTDTCTPKNGYESFSFRPCEDEIIEDTLNTTFNVYNPKYGQSEWRDETRVRTYDAAHYDLVEQTACDRRSHLSVEECEQEFHAAYSSLRWLGNLYEKERIAGCAVEDGDMYFNAYLYDSAKQPSSGDKVVCRRHFEHFTETFGPTECLYLNHELEVSKASLLDCQNYAQDNGYSAFSWKASRCLLAMDRGPCETNAAWQSRFFLPAPYEAKPRGFCSHLETSDYAYMPTTKTYSNLQCSQHCDEDPNCIVYGSETALSAEGGCTKYFACKFEVCTESNCKDTTAQHWTRRYNFYFRREHAAFQRNENKEYSILPLLQCAQNETAESRIVQVPWGPEGYGVVWKTNGVAYATEQEAKAACLAGCPGIYQDVSSVAYYALDRLEQAYEMVPTDPSYALHKHRLRNLDNFQNKRLTTHFVSTSKEECHAQCMLETTCRMAQFAYGQCVFYDEIHESLSSSLPSVVMYQERKGAVSYGPSGDCWLYKNEIGHHFSDSLDGDCREIVSTSTGYSTFAVDERLAGENKVVYLLAEPDLSQATQATLVHEQRSQAWCNDRDDGEKYTKVGDFACGGGVWVRMYEGNGDNPCTGDTDCVETCADACIARQDPLDDKTWQAMDDAGGLKGFVISFYSGQEGRCYCQSADSSTCTQQSAAFYDRYDIDDGQASWAAYPDIVSEKEEDACSGEWVRKANIERANVLQRECELQDSKMLSWTRNEDVVTATVGKGGYKVEYENGYKLRLGHTCGALDLEMVSEIYGQACFKETPCAEAHHGHGHGYAVINNVCYAYLHEAGGNRSDCRWKRTGRSYLPIAKTNLPEAIEACNARESCGGICERNVSDVRSFVLAKRDIASKEAAPACYAGWQGEDCTTLLPSNWTGESITEKRHTAIDFCEQRGQTLCSNDYYQVSPNDHYCVDNGGSLYSGSKNNAQCIQLCKDTPTCNFFSMTSTWCMLHENCDAFGSNGSPYTAYRLHRPCVHYEGAADCVVEDYSAIHAVALCCGRAEKSGKFVREGVFYEREEQLGACAYPKELSGSTLGDSTPKLTDTYTVQQIAKGLCVGGVSATGNCEEACYADDTCLYFSNSTVECTLHSTCDRFRNHFNEVEAGQWVKVSGEYHILGGGTAYTSVSNQQDCFDTCRENGFSYSSFATNSVKCRCDNHDSHAHPYQGGGGMGVYSLATENTTVGAFRLRRKQGRYDRPQRKHEMIGDCKYQYTVRGSDIVEQASYAEASDELVPWRCERASVPLDRTLRLLRHSINESFKFDVMEEHSLADTQGIELSYQALDYSDHVYSEVGAPISEWTKKPYGEYHILGGGTAYTSVYTQQDCFDTCRENGFSYSSFATNSVKCRCDNKDSHAHDYQGGGGMGVYFLLRRGGLEACLEANEGKVNSYDPATKLCRTFHDPPSAIPTQATFLGQSYRSAGLFEEFRLASLPDWLVVVQSTHPALTEEVNIGTGDLSLSKAECKALAGDNTFTDYDKDGREEWRNKRPVGCYVFDNRAWYWNGLGVYDNSLQYSEDCSSGSFTCIQKRHVDWALSSAADECEVFCLQTDCEGYAMSGQECKLIAMPSDAYVDRSFSSITSYYCFDYDAYKAITVDDLSSCQKSCDDAVGLASCNAVAFSDSGLCNLYQGCSMSTSVTVDWGFRYYEKVNRLDYLRAVKPSGSVIVRLRTPSELVCRPNAAGWRLTAFEAASMPPLATTEVIGSAATLEQCRHLFLNDVRTPRLDTLLYNGEECRISLLRDSLVEAEGASSIDGFQAYRIASSARMPYRTEATASETEDIARETCLPSSGLLAGRDCDSIECAAFWFREEDVIRHGVAEELCAPTLPPQPPLLSFAWDRNAQGRLTFNVEEEVCRQSNQFMSWRAGTEGREKIVVQSEAECLAKTTEGMVAVFVGNDPLPDHRSACNGIVAEHSFERIFPHAILMVHSEGTRIVSSQASIDECAAHANAYYAHQNRSTESKIFEYSFGASQCALFAEIECPTLCLPDEEGKPGFSAFRLHGETSLTAASCWLLSVLDSQSTGSTYCRKCPLGKHSARAGSNCLPCQQGRYADKTGLRACKSCPAGKYQFGSGESHCHMCPAGSYQDVGEGKRSCKLCAAGKYEENNECISCPAGKAAPDNFVANAAGELVYTGAAYKGPLLYYDSRFDYSDVHGLSFKEADGTYMKGYSPVFTLLRKLQMDQHDSLEDCISCETGTYTNQSGASECISCAEGQYNDALGATSCTSCSVGRVARPSNAAFHELMPFACSSAEELGEYREYKDDPQTGEDIGLVREEAKAHLEECFEACKAEQACLYVSYKPGSCRLHRKCDEKGDGGWTAYRESRVTSSASDSTAYALSVEATVYGPPHHECEEDTILLAPESYVHFGGYGISAEGTIGTALTYASAIEQCNTMRSCVGFTYAGAEDVSLRVFSQENPILLKAQSDMFEQSGLQAWFKETPVQTKKDCVNQCAQLAGCRYMEWNTTKTCRKWSSCTPTKKASLTAPESSLYRVRLGASFELFPFQGRWPCDAVVFGGKTKEECEAEAVARTMPMFYFDNGTCHLYQSFADGGIDDLYSGLAGRQSSVCLSGSTPPPFEDAEGRLYLVGKRGWDERATGCSFCPAGLHTEVAGATLCRQCSAGRYDKNPQSSNPCQACELGRFQDEPGQATCKACSAGRYQDNTGGERCKASGQGYRAVGQGFPQSVDLQWKSSGPRQNNTYKEVVELEFEGATTREICGRNSFAAGYENVHCDKVPVGAISVTRARTWTKEAQACLYDKEEALAYRNVSTEIAFYEGDLFNRMGLHSLDDCIAFANERNTGVVAVSYGEGLCHFYSDTSDGLVPSCVPLQHYVSASLAIGETRHSDEPVVNPEWFQQWSPHDGVRFVSPYECTGIHYVDIGDYYSASDCVNICRQSRNNGVAACRYVSYSSNDNKCYLVNWEDGLEVNPDGSGQSGKIFQTTVSNIEEACSYGSRTVPRNSGDTEVGSGGYRVKDHVPGARVGNFTEYSITGEGTTFGQTMKIVGRKGANRFSSLGTGGFYSRSIVLLNNTDISAHFDLVPTTPFCEGSINVEHLGPASIDLESFTIVGDDFTTSIKMAVMFPHFVQMETHNGNDYLFLHVAWPSTLTCNGFVWKWDANGQFLASSSTGDFMHEHYGLDGHIYREYAGDWDVHEHYWLYFSTEQKGAMICNVDSFYTKKFVWLDGKPDPGYPNLADYSPYRRVYFKYKFAVPNAYQTGCSGSSNLEIIVTKDWDLVNRFKSSYNKLVEYEATESEWYIPECENADRVGFTSSCRWLRRRFYDRLSTVLLQQHTLATNVFPNYKIEDGYQGDNLLRTLGFYDIHDLNEENENENGPLEFTYKRVNHISYNHSSIMPLFDVGTNEDNFDTTDTSMANFRAVKGGNTFEYCSGSTTQPAAPYSPASCDDLGYPFIIDRLESTSSGKKVCVKAGSSPLEKCCIGAQCNSSTPLCMNAKEYSGLASVPYTILQHLSFDVGDAAVLYTHSDNSATRGLAYAKDKCSQEGNACLGVSLNVDEDEDGFFYTHAPSLALKIKINTDRDLLLKAVDYKEEGLATIENATEEEGADTLRACYEICLRTRFCTMFSFRPSNSGCFLQRDPFARVIDSETQVLFTLHKNVDDTSKAQFCAPCAVGSTASSANQGGTGVCKACKPGKISSTSGIFVAEEQVGLAAQEDCQACPVGMLYLAATASCIACPKGFACAREESYFGSAVTQCNNHEYSTSSLLDFEGEGVSTSASLRCDYCTAGKYNNVQGAEYCEKCPKGFYSTIRQSCEPCPVGSYTMTTASDQCFQVDSQSYIAWPASTMSDKKLCTTDDCATAETRTCVGTEDAYCQACPELRPGHRTYAAGTICVVEKCDPGTYSTNGCVGRDCCIPCTSNCKAGQHSLGCGDPDNDQGGSTQNTQCTDCPADTYTEFDALGAPCVATGAGPNFGSQGTCAKCAEAPHIIGDGFTTASPFTHIGYSHPQTHTDQRRCAAGSINTGYPTNSFAEADRLTQCCSAAAYKCIPCRSSESVSYYYFFGTTLSWGRTNQPAWSTGGLPGKTYCQSYWYLWNKDARDAIVDFDDGYGSDDDDDDGDDCFPSDGIVETPEGKKPMYQLKIGDFALSHKGFSQVYLLGHADNHTVTHYIRLTTDNGTSLRLSKEHFIESNGRYVYAKEVKKGDRLAYGETVVKIEREKGKGLFNPFTVAGTIAVDGVLCSCHSDWFLEALPENLRPDASLIPHIYQTLMAPVRTIFQRNSQWVRRFQRSFDGKAIGENSMRDILKKLWETY